MNKSYATTLFVLLFASLALAIPTKKMLPKNLMNDRFFAANSREASMEYQGTVMLNSLSTPDEAAVRKQIEKQVPFLFGILSANQQQGVPKRDHKIQLISTQLARAGVYAIQYKFVGTIQIEGNLPSVRLLLPVNPSTIHQDAAKTPACLDEGHPDAHYFWYYYNPRKPGCGLKEGIHYNIVSALLKYKLNTQATYPEYAKLIDSKNVITINIIFGMDDGSKSLNPMESYDYNAYNYRDFRAGQLMQGFKSKIYSKTDVTKLVGTSPQTPYIEELTKAIPNRPTVRILMFFGPIDSYSGVTFHRYLAASLKAASVTIYTGHSGLGEYLDIKLIEKSIGGKLELPKDRYQIVFWNGCSSYPYYNQMYFDLKTTMQDPTGTKNMDAIANGLATLFTAIEPSSSALVNAVSLWAETGKRTSYQEIITAADTDNLISVSGDEDNGN